MKKSHYSQVQTVAILKEGEAGIPVYGGLEVSELQRLRQLEEENRRLKAIYAKTRLEKEILQEALEGKL